MPAIRLSVFKGESPRLSHRTLGDVQAQAAINLRLTSGRIDPVFYPETVVAANPISEDIESMYRMYSGSTSYWLNWEGDVDVAKGPVIGDTSFRVYFTSDTFEPRVTNLALATSTSVYPTAWYVLGVTPPTTAPSLAAVGGSGTLEDRVYAYTFVTQWGEESAPSPASAIVNGYPSATWTISAMQVAPGNTYAISAAAWSGGVLTVTVASTFGLRAGEYVTLSLLAPVVLNASWKVATVADTTHFTILMATPGSITDQVGVATRNAPHNTTSMLKRIYRSVTSSTATDYYFVKEVAVATTSTTDDAGTDIGEPIATTGWAMPPVDLRGIRTLPSGAMVGFRGNELYYSEPLAPYAWPVAYALTTDYTVVGIGAFETSVVVTTEGTPYVATGVDPASATMTRLDQQWPCLSKRGIVELGYGVAWPAPQGLVVVGAQGAQLLTSKFYTTVEWAEIAPDTFIAAHYDNRYYAGYEISSQEWGMFVLDIAGGMTHRMSPKIAGAYTDKGTGLMYIIEGGDIKQWDADLSQRMPFEWWSKDIVTPAPLNLGAARVEADFLVTAEEAAAVAASGTAQRVLNAAMIVAKSSKGSFNGASANTYSLNGSRVLEAGDAAAVRAVTFELYTYGELTASKTLLDSGTFRLPAGAKYDEFSVRLMGNVPVDAVLVGETPLSLKSA